MKTKINALALYMASDEVIKWITSKNLDIKEEIQEKIEFIKLVEGKDIIIKWYDEENVFISQYDNSKKYQFPLFILDNWENQEEQEEKEENILFNYFKKNMITIFWILFVICLCSWLLLYRDYLEYAKHEETKQISEFDIKYNRINEINLIIANELEIQKNARQIEKDSIKKVAELEKEQTNLRLESLNLSHYLK